MRGLYGVDKHPISGVWRVRITVPEHLWAIVGRKTYSKTLATKDAAEARRRAPAIQESFAKVIRDAQVRHDADHRQQDAPLVLTREAASTAIAAWLAETQGAMADAIWRSGPKVGLGRLFPEFGCGGPLAFERAFRMAVIEGYASGATPSDWARPLHDLLYRVLTAHGVLVPPVKHPAVEAALTMLHRAVGELAASQRSLMGGEWALPTAMPATTAASPSKAISNAYRPEALADQAKPGSRDITLKAMLEAHIKKTQPQPTSEYDMRLAVRRLLAFLQVENIDMSKITFEQSEAFNLALRKLPVRMSAKDWNRGLPALIEDYDTGKDSRPRIAAPTVAKVINLLAAMQRSALKRGRVGEAVFSGLVSRADRKPVTPRLPFSAQHITTIFSSPLFTGCAGPKDWKRRGDFIVDDHRRWIPIIAATMGVRLEEAGQLLVADVRQQDGVKYLEITELDDESPEQSKNVKTSSSRRRVPLHPALIASGFQDYVEARRDAGDTRLFPKLKQNAKKKLTAKFSQWFNQEFLPSVGLEARNRRFHSFRHYIIDRAREADFVKDDVRRALFGHTHGSAHDRYGNGFSLRVLNEAMAQVEIAGFPLDMLASPGQDRGPAGAGGRASPGSAVLRREHAPHGAVEGHDHLPEGEAGAEHSQAA